MLILGEKPSDLCRLLSFGVGSGSLKKLSKNEKNRDFKRVFLFYSLDFLL